MLLRALTRCAAINGRYESSHGVKVLKLALGLKKLKLVAFKPAACAPARRAAPFNTRAQPRAAHSCCVCCAAVASLTGAQQSG